MMRLKLRIMGFAPVKGEYYDGSKNMPRSYKAYECANELEKNLAEAGASCDTCNNKSRLCKELPNPCIFYVGSLSF